jgi:hypothetical protein
MKNSAFDKTGVRRRILHKSSPGSTVSLSSAPIASTGAEGELIKRDNQQDRVKAVSKRTQARERMKLQKLRRAKILKTIFEANQELNRKEKTDAKKFWEHNQSMHMVEVHRIIRNGLMKKLMIENTDTKDIKSLNVNISEVCATPALKFDSSIFSEKIELDSIDLLNLPPSELHPVGWRYFFIRESKRKSAVFNQTIQHPVFFTSDFERQPSRHSKVAITIAKLITQSRQVGESYRAARGIERCTAIPPEDVMGAKEGKIDIKVSKKGSKGVHFTDTEEKLVKYDKTMLARVTIKSIKVLDLASVHLTERNSPFVVLSCGKDKFHTEIYAYAGLNFSYFII